ncbi:hypothetical protein BDQ17DRAFT_1326447 [Cyathus striatus]|nr:hypothetical protein BDQ17DRAFT_1326447 [Cyathus striatus]
MVHEVEANNESDECSILPPQELPTQHPDEKVSSQLQDEEDDDSVERKALYSANPPEEVATKKANKSSTLGHWKLAINTPSEEDIIENFIQTPVTKEMEGILVPPIIILDELLHIDIQKVNL